MTNTCRRGLVAALLLAPAAAFAAPAQATERFSVSLAGTWKTEGHVTDTTCYRLADPESTDMIPFTGQFDTVETGRFGTVRVGTAVATRRNGKIEIGSTGRPLRLSVDLDRQSELVQECKPGENNDTPPPDCGARQRRYGVGVFNEGAAMTFGFVSTTKNPLGQSETYYDTQSDPYRNCPLAMIQQWLGALSKEDGAAGAYGFARVSRTALLNRRRRTFVLRGFAEGHPRKDDRNEEGEGETIAADYRLDWTLTLRRLSRRSRG